MQQGTVKRGGRGRLRLRPNRLVADKGYSSRKIRHYARSHCIRTTISHKCNEQRSGPFEKSIERQRYRVERLINCIKQFRHLAAYYDKRAENYRTLWIIAATILWL